MPTGGDTVNERRTVTRAYRGRKGGLREGYMKRPAMLHSAVLLQGRPALQTGIPAWEQTIWTLGRKRSRVQASGATVLHGW